MFVNAGSSPIPAFAIFGEDMMQRFSTSLTAVLIVASFVAMFGIAPACADEPFPAPKLRLPADVVAPVRYRLDLTVIPDQDTFTGIVEIDVRFAKSTSLFWLNAQKLKVKEATLIVGAEKLDARVISEPKDFIGFALTHPVAPGEATLRVTYQGEISRKDMQGVFQVKDGEHWYVYTQFEDTSARQAFPCFDEPGYKVPWQLTLHLKNNQQAFSNTPIDSETDTHDGMKIVRFAETKPLPSYLVAFSVGDFEVVPAGTAGKKNTNIRIVVPRGRAAEATYAAQTTGAIVGLLEDYFGIPYPYEKLDEVAVPLFDVAMENAGQVTFPLPVILAKPDRDTPERQRTWVWVAAHELAHQWSGDLVTTAWWDDLWLNEGFANWIANKIVNEYHPEWQWNVGEVNGTQDAMIQDGLMSARRVRQPIESVDDIANAFDEITYHKGNALLYMFETYLGPDHFREGVHRYLEKYAWKSATSADFLTMLAGDDPAVASAFSSFLDQPGIPLITVNLDCNEKMPRVELSQERFLPLGSRGAEPQLWKIPVFLRYRTASGEQWQSLVLDQAVQQVTLSKAESCPGWLVANADAAGYYRVLYRGELLSNLLNDDARVLSKREKVALIGDMSALSGSGKLALETALASAPDLAQDSNRRVIVKTMEITTDPKGNLVPADLRPQYRRYLEDLYGERARNLGWKAKPGESEEDRLLRPAILDVVANQAEDPELVAQAKALAFAWLEDRQVVTPDMVGTVLKSAARHGDQVLFDRMRAAAKQEGDERRRGELLYALGLFPQPEIANAALSILLTDEFDHRQSILILGGANDSSTNRELAYDFVKKNWEVLIGKLPEEWGASMPFVADAFCDEQHRQDAAAFFEGRSTKYKGGPRTLAQTLEGIDLCVAYKKAQQPSLTRFLGRYR
jgi:alanyl aminopeptidase